MKKLLLVTILSLAVCISVQAQDFNKHLATAKSSYSSGKLEESRFAMQQMLQELDMLTGKEVLKVLPAKMGSLDANAANDNVTGATGFAGVIIHREYGAADKTASIEIISNSPLIASLNAILSIPFIGTAANGDRKVIKIEGYKALIQKNTDSETKKVSYDVQVPLGSTLVTLKVDNATEDIVKLSNNIPVAQIAKLLQ
jgi:hypothetical protein